MAFRDDGALPENLRPLGPGDPTELGGHRIVGILGQGGMGTVYLGQMRSGRRLAVKVVRAEYAHDTDFLARFRREVEAALRVRGPRTAMLVDADLDHELPWLATEYVPGPTLSQRVKESGPLDEHAVRDLVLHLAQGLTDVHRAGMVHRDLKPANVILGPDGPCVIDMGIARAADATSLTATGAMLGTPVFMAPEQALGRPTSPATDVWSLGAVAHYAATGRMPFGLARPDVMYFRVVHEAPDLTGCPDSLLPFVTACLTKDPAGRPTLGEAIATFSARPAVAAAPPEPDDLPTHVSATAAPPPVGLDGPVALTPPEPEPHRRGRRGWLVAALAVAGLVVVSGAGVGIALALQDEADPDPVAAHTPSAEATVAESAPEAEDIPEAEEPSADDVPARSPGELDPCLVGRWVQTSMTDSRTTLGGPADVTGWDGRILEFTADGVETVEFDDADPVVVESPEGTATETWHGSATYDVVTADGVLDFRDVDYSATRVDHETVDGHDVTTEPPGLLPVDVDYTCDDTTHTQERVDYRATFERLDGPDAAFLGGLG